MNSTIISSIAALVVLAAIFGYIIWKRKRDPQGKEELDRFLASLETSFQAYILRYVETIDITNFMNLSVAQEEILEELYENLWQIARDELARTTTDEFNKQLIEKLLTKENIKAIVKQIYESEQVQELFTKKYNTAVLNASKDALALEDEYLKKFEEYGNVDGVEPVLQPAEPFQDKPGPMPHHDEEVAVDPADESVEIVDDQVLRRTTQSLFETI